MQGKEYIARARIALSNPGAIIAQLCDHMLEHNVEVSESPAGPILILGDVRTQFSSDGEATLVDIVAPDLEGLYFARMSVASHILEFAGENPPLIAWTGDGSEIVRPPNFQILDVVGCRMVTPHMRRLTFSGENVARFAGLDALNLNLMIQHPDAQEPQWPRVRESGVIAWDQPELRPMMRKYTVRSVDCAAGTLDIDFVLHADAGPGAGFAQMAEVGDRVGVVGPGGGGLVSADWYLFAGDETALPAIARMLESLPADARGKIFLEVADASEMQTLILPSGCEIEWLLRCDRPAGATGVLANRVRACGFPSGNKAIYVWAGSEFEDFRSIRAFVRKDARHANIKHLVVSYWRRGAPEEQ